MLAVTLLAGCEKEPGDDGKQIQLPNSGEQTQQAYADEEATSGFTFTAKSAWTASVTESARSTSGVEWLRLLLGGTETYSGAAGTFTLTIELSPNYTGQPRSATITIESGGEKITITVTQDGVTATGKQPTVRQKLISKIVMRFTGGNGGMSGDATFNFTYDDNDRVKKMEITDIDGRGTPSSYEYTYLPDKVNVDWVETWAGGSRTGMKEATLNAEGYATSVVSKYRNDPESEYRERYSTIEYKNNRFYKVTTLDGWGEYEGGATCKWNEAGNITEIINEKIHYSSYLNNFNLDINWFTGGISIYGLDCFIDVGIFKGRCNNLVSLCGDDDRRVAFQYTFDNGLLVKIEESINNDLAVVYDISYQ